MRSPALMNKTTLFTRTERPIRPRSCTPRANDSMVKRSLGQLETPYHAITGPRLRSHRHF
jgi:hypothetical protein